MKKVLITLYYYHPYVSGVSVYAKRLAEELVQEGFEVTVLTSRFEKDLPKKEIINGVNIIRKPVLFSLGKGVIMPTYWLNLIIYSFKFDYINPHLPLAEIGLSSLFIPREKIITTYQCDISLGEGLLNKILNEISLNLMKLALFRSKKIVVLSYDYLKHSRMKNFSGKAIQIYPPINEKDFQQCDSEKLAKKIGLNSSEPKIGFVGRIVYEKGVKYLLQSLESIRKEYPNAKLIIAGDYKKIAGGSVMESLEEYIKKYSDNIVFTGYLTDEELKQFYSLIDILVLPSIHKLEAFGMVQVEALLSGTPVIASDLPGVREVIKKSGFGLLSEPKNPKDIADKILTVLKNKEKYKPKREEVIKYFGINNFIKAYKKIFEES